MMWLDKYVRLFGGDTGKAILTGVLACLALLIVGLFCGILYAASTACLRIRRAISERKSRRRAYARKLKYTLPDKDNTFVRARLFNSLQPEIEGEIEGIDQRSVGVRLGYTRKMLSCVREAALSPIERLDVEEMAKLLAAYADKEKWSSADLKAVNDIFSRLLKLSAKYEIAV